MIVDAPSPVFMAAVEGLAPEFKTLPPWLFYDERGSHLFEQITALPEYYLTRTERMLLEQYSEEILQSFSAPVTIAELGAGTATKTGVLLAAAVRIQSNIVYQPIDVSPSALEEAAANIADRIPGVIVRPQVSNYTTDSISIERPDKGTKILVLYIGSSIGNFSPAEARGILLNLRSQLLPGDALLLGTDLAPGPNKSVEQLLTAYNDSQGVTAAFNRNILTRINRELGANFDPGCFTHDVRWNELESRIEMHLRAKIDQTVTIPGAGSASQLHVYLAKGESIHTENSYKFNAAAIADLLTSTGFTSTTTYHDSAQLFAVTLAAVV